MERAFESWEIRDLCVRNGWFTCGTEESYEKLFKLCEENACFSDIALAIWLCTPDSDRNSITNRIYGESASKDIEECLSKLNDWKFLTGEEFHSIINKLEALHGDYRNFMVGRFTDE